MHNRIVCLITTVLMFFQHSAALHAASLSDTERQQITAVAQTIIDQAAGEDPAWQDHFRPEFADKVTRLAQIVGFVETEDSVAVKSKLLEQVRAKLAGSTVTIQELSDSVLVSSFLPFTKQGDTWQPATPLFVEELINHLQIENALTRPNDFTQLLPLKVTDRDAAGEFRANLGLTKNVRTWSLVRNHIQLGSTYLLIGTPYPREEQRVEKLLALADQAFDLSAVYTIHVSSLKGEINSVFWRKPDRSWERFEGMLYKGAQERLSQHSDPEIRSRAILNLANWQRRGGDKKQARGLLLSLQNAYPELSLDLRRYLLRSVAYLRDAETFDAYKEAAAVWNHALAMDQSTFIQTSKTPITTRENPCAISMLAAYELDVEVDAQGKIQALLGVRGTRGKWDSDFERQEFGSAGVPATFTTANLVERTHRPAKPGMLKKIDKRASKLIQKINSVPRWDGEKLIAHQALLKRMCPPFWVAQQDAAQQF
ncbi:MAG: hypothetical protein AAF529_24845 [Pseudomonadota bacterium]